jgi:hypothetical protein
MGQETYQFTVKAEDPAAAGSGATALMDALQEVDGIIKANRLKGDESAMDLGEIVSIVANSGATLAIAGGVAAWLRLRRGATIIIEKDGSSGSIKAAVQDIDAEAAVRIAEIVRKT